MIRTFSPVRADVGSADMLPSFLRPLIESAHAGSDLHPPVVAALDDLGFSSMMYGGSAAPLRAPRRDAPLYVFTTHSSAWVSRYEAQHYVEVDPRIALTWDTTLPLLWDQDSVRGRSAEVDAFLDDALAHGIGSGIALCYRTPLNTRAVIFLNQAFPVISPSRRAEIERRIGDIYLFFTVFHGIFTASIIECLNNAPPQAGAPMSEVEGAALGLLGRGLTPAAAAEAMALDTDEVVRLLRNACTKLGVSTPEVAIRQAAALGFFGSGSVK